MNTIGTAASVKLLPETPPMAAPIPIATAKVSDSAPMTKSATYPPPYSPIDTWNAGSLCAGRSRIAAQRFRCETLSGSLVFSASGPLKPMDRRLRPETYVRSSRHRLLRLIRVST